MVLACLLFFSVGSLGYVIFFRTVLAAEVVSPGEADFIFEEPDPPLHGHSGDRIVRSERNVFPRIAIIIDDMGYHHKIGEQLLELPLNLTFSFLPDAPFTKILEGRAYGQERTILLHQPLQARDDKWNPGPSGLYLGQMLKQKEILANNLKRVPHAEGVNNHMGSLYSEDEPHMKAFLNIIADSNLFYVDSFTTAESVGFRLAKEMGVKTARRHVFLDNIHSTDIICDQLEKLVNIAEENGGAIGIGHPYQETLEALTDCYEKFSTRVELVGVEHLVQ